MLIDVWINKTKYNEYFFYIASVEYGFLDLDDLIASFLKISPKVYHERLAKIFPKSKLVNKNFYFKKNRKISEDECVNLFKEEFAPELTLISL